MLSCDFQYKHDQFSLNAQFKMNQQIIGITGASGIGKTSLLRNIVGLVHPTQGSIELNQLKLFNRDLNICVPTYQRRIALIFQKALLFPHMNVSQNLNYSKNHRTNLKKNAGDLEKKIGFEQVIQILELETLLQRKAHQLSGGEAQRVSIGRALMSSPSLLLLDEPLSGLDHHLKTQILFFLKNIHQHYKIPMLYVTHHHQELDQLNADVYQMIKNDQNISTILF